MSGMLSIFGLKIISRCSLGAITACVVKKISKHAYHTIGKGLEGE